MEIKLKENERNKYIDKYVVLVRKSAHFTIYLILGLLILSFIREFRVVDYRAVLLSVFLTFLYACSDEVHQLFVPGRSGEFLDVLLDSVGALSVCLLYTLYYKIRRKLYE